ncbi:MAG TPA: metallopeptidase TldD-related protein [Candidatus Nanoarchaeia archaeon]|nr:metallopeptidase TldD-related protein [Candidatus Nanoarchaeia archaeon]
MVENKVTQLKQALEQRSDLIDWRFALSNSSSIKIGMEMGEIGGPYRPPVIGSGLSATLYAVWEDGTVSDADIEPHHFSDLQGNLDEWRSQSREDPDKARILTPQQYLPVKIYDSEVARLLEDPSPLFGILSLYQKALKGQGTENIQASASVQVGRKFLLSSTGMEGFYAYTSMDTYCVLDEIHISGDSSRKIIGKSCAQKFVEQTLLWYRRSKENVEMPTGEVDVIFSSGFTGQLMGKFIVYHISGSNVAEGKSRFTRDDFVSGKQILSEKISIVHDGIKDWDNNSAPFSSEGVANSSQYLIHKGRLLQPYTGVKWADKLGFKPVGSGRMYLKVPDAAPLEEMIADTQEGVLIHGVLGLHGQNEAKGDYSVPSYLAHRIVGGKVVGSGNVSITGNVFDNFSEEQMTFTFDQLDQLEVGFKIRTNVKGLGK